MDCTAEKIKFVVYNNTSFFYYKNVKFYFHEKMSKIKNVPIIFTAALLLAILVLNIIEIIYIAKIKKRSEVVVEDINIKSFKSFNFVEYSTKPIYDPYGENLGLTGKLYLTCYSGACSKDIIVRRKKGDCDDKRLPCYYYDDKEIESFIEYDCSKQCYELKQDYCNNCPIEYESQGICSVNNDDNYDANKACVGDNIIYFWKGKKYQIENVDAFKKKNYTYLNDAKLKDEECPENTKYCGILDDEENKLCLPLNSECPTNIISIEKLNQSDYSTSIIGNKTIYYTYDKNAIKNKIIAGLYVDSDIYFNKEEDENNIVLDTYTISGLINDNYLLYRGVDLGYDPYEINNIDEKGKSYLKVAYNSKKPNFVSMRERHDQFIKNKAMNENVIKPIRRTLKFYIIGIFFYIICFLFLICLILYKNNIKKYCFIGLLLISFIYSLISLIMACKNISRFNKAKKIDSINNYHNAKKANIIFVILSILLYPVYIVSVPLYLKN